MAGILFIICIPTVEEEAVIQSKVQSDLAARSPPKTPTTTKDLRYGTFEPQIPKDAHCSSTDVKSPAKTLGTKPVIVTPSYKQRDVEAAPLAKAKSTTSRDEGDGLRKILLGTSSKSLLAGSSSSDSGIKWRGSCALDEADLDLAPNAPMVDVVKAIISVTRVENAVWTEGNSRKKWQVIFSVEASPRTENIVRILNEWGIGDRAGSFVTILPCTLYKNAAENQSEDSEKRASASDLTQDDPQNGWERFVSSVTARYNVAQLVEKVRSMAEFTFDFISLLIVASLVALFGLVENNSLFLAASMLISPLMGPIVAATFGTVIKDKKLQIFGVVNELYGIAIVTLVGFIGGFIFCLVDSRFGDDDGNGMTNEMVSRSLIHSVIIGIFVAIPSGIAVAIGILGDNFGSLAGVAISASLLPPAVNTGLMFAFAVIYKIFEGDEARFNTLIKSDMYSNHQSVELAVMGAISMCVTLTNVISIYIMGIVFLKIKEVAPNVPANVRQFWRHDIKIARDYNKNHTDDNNADLRRTLEDEIAGYEEEFGNRSELMRKLERHLTTSHQKTWSPTTCNLTYHPVEGRRPSIQDLFAGQNQLSVFYPHQLSFQNQNSRVNDQVLRRASIATTTTKPRIKIFHPLNKIHEVSNYTPSPPHRTVTLIEPEKLPHHHFHPVAGPSRSLDDVSEGEKRGELPHRSSVGSLKKFVVIPVTDKENEGPSDKSNEPKE